MSELFKRCCTCKVEKPLEAFSKRARNKDGLREACKECCNAKQKIYNEAHKEEISIRGKSHYVENKEAISSQHKTYRATRKEETAARDKAYREANPEKTKARSAAYYEAHKEERIAYAAAWNRAHPEKQLELVHRRNARKRNAFVESVSHLKVFERDEWICGICLEDVDPTIKFPNPLAKSLDHIIPLSKGGEHSYANVQLAHFGCNASKGNKI